MGKSIQDKLSSAIESADKLLSEAVIGDQEGQYPEPAAAAFSTGIDFAQSVAVDDVADDDKRKEALDTLTDAVKSFKASIIKPEPPKAQEPKKVGIKDVTLKGSASQKTGTHSIFIGSQIVTFIDGKANLPEQLANEVINAGYAE